METVVISLFILIYYAIIAGTAIYGNPLDILAFLYFAYLATVSVLIYTLFFGITVPHHH